MIAIKNIEILGVLKASNYIEKFDSSLRYFMSILKFLGWHYVAKFHFFEHERFSVFIVTFWLWKRKEKHSLHLIQVFKNKFEFPEGTFLTAQKKKKLYEVNRARALQRY